MAGRECAATNIKRITTKPFMRDEVALIGGGGYAIWKYNPLPPLLSRMHGLTGCVFQRAFKFPDYTRNRSPLQEKNHNSQTKKDRMITLFHLIRNKYMHVITYSPNFATPHFAARGIPRNTPHGTMEGHTAYIYTLSVYPFRMEIFSFFSVHKAHTCTA
jgi:hypothetical protein